MPQTMPQTQIDEPDVDPDTTPHQPLTPEVLCHIRNCTTTSDAYARALLEHIDYLDDQLEMVAEQRDAYRDRLAKLRDAVRVRPRMGTQTE